VPDVKWTPSLIEERFVEAAEVMKRLPNVRVPGHFNTWPKMMQEFADMIGQEPRPMRLPPPSAEAITRMEQTLEWLRWLDAADAKIVWLRATGERWKTICWKVGLARTAANQRWLYALCVITWKLSGHVLPRGRSRQHVIELARARQARAG